MNTDQKRVTQIPYIIFQLKYPDFHKPMNIRVYPCLSVPIRGSNSIFKINPACTNPIVFFLLFALLVTQFAKASNIQWDAPQNISGPSEVSTEGHYFGAWSPGNATIPVGTVNGVQMRGDDLELTTSGFAGSAAAFGTHTTADATYNNLLQYGTWSDDTSASFTINGTGRRPLTPGRQYLVQVWVSDARAEITGRTETVSGSGTLSYKTGSGMGQYVVGRFTADAASQAVTLSASVSAQVNLVQVRDITPEDPETRQQRWKRLKYGIFSHYTYAQTGDAVTSGARFNAEAYANDVAQAGAEYVVWTAWHSNTIPMFPSKAMDQYGFSGRYSERDTVSDMIDAVRAKGIRVFLYVHPYQPLIYDTTGHNNFINELFAETVDRYGSRIDGLWIDENMIDGTQDSAVDYKRLVATVKSRNPDLVLMQNGGQMYTVDMGGPETVGDWNFARWQCMYNYANPGNGPGAEDMLRTMVLNAASNYDGGGVHWSVDGKVDAGLVETARLFQLGQYLAPIRASICGTKPSASFPPPAFSGDALRYASVDQWVAADALDDSKVYIHVMKPPTATVVTLPTPVDGKIFSSAKLLANGHAVELTQNLHDGVRLTLPDTDTWDSLDTVIELTVASKGGAGLVNDTSRNITYTGSSWSYRKARGNGEFGDDVHFATANGDAFTFTFSGTDVDYIATRDASRGQVELYIDNVLQTTVDLSTGSPTGSRQVAYSKSGLARGTHTLQGIKRSGTSMDVDCFKVTDLVNDSDPELASSYQITMSGSVSAYGGPSNWWQPGYNGVSMITPAVNYYPGYEPLNDPLNHVPDSDWFETSFTGTGVQIPLSCAYSWGYFYVQLDGVFHSNVQVQAGRVDTLNISGLANGTHTVKCITWRATTDPVQPGLNGITVTRPDIWTAASRRGYGELGDDVHSTDLNPGTFRWTFDGSGVEPIITRDSDARMAWFSVSGADVNITARLQNFAQTRQVGTSVFSLPNLVRGSHTLSISHGANMSGLNFSFARLAIDGIRVYKGESLQMPALDWGTTGGGGTGTWDTNTTANWFDGASSVNWPTVGGLEDEALFDGTAGTVTLSGTVAANRLMFNTTGYALQGGTLTLNGDAPTISTASGVGATISSGVAGSAGLVKSGTGTLTLSSATSYTGTTTVKGGTLLVNGSLAAASVVTVASNATLGGSGTVGGAVTVESSGTLAPGASGADTLTVGSATLAGHLAIQIDGENVDRLAATGNLDISACTLDLSLMVGGITRLDYVIATYGSLTGSQFAAVTGLPTGYQLSFDTANKRILLIGELTQAPRGLIAVGGVGRMTLGWLPTVQETEGTYQVERATSSGGAYTVLSKTATGGSYVDTTVAAGTTYFYIVSVTAGGSVGPASNEASATTVAAGALPTGWQQANVGTAAGVPFTNFTSGVFSVNGAGAQITSNVTTDSFRYVYMPMVGDCTITARVSAIGSTTSAAKAGVMIRESLANNAREACTLVTPNNTRAFIWRLTAGSRSGATSVASSDRWVRIERKGTTFKSYGSADGITWTQIGATKTISMSNTATYDVGLVVSSGSTTTLSAAQFDNVSITGGRPTNLAATVTDAQVNLSWTGVTNATSYNIKRSSVNGGPYTTVSTSTSTTYADAPTADGTATYYVVSATVSGGESADSDQVVTRPELPVPAAVTGLTTVAGTGQIGLTWSAAANATSYSVRRGTSASGPFNQIATTASLSYTDTTTPSGTVHYYTIVAVNADNTGAACAAASAVASGSGTWTAEADGDWNSGGNWLDGQVAFGAGCSATFAQSGGITVNQNVDGLTLGNLSVTGGNVTLAGNGMTLEVTSGSPQISVASGVTATITAPFAGNGGLVKSGTGTLTLTASNSYTGTTLVSGGTLVNGSASASSSVTVANLAILGGTGNIGGGITVNTGGTLAPGVSIGTLAAGSATINGTLAIEISGSSADQLNVSGNLNITNATLAITGTPSEQEYVIANYGTLTGTAFASITGLPAGYGVDYSSNQIRIVANPTFASWIEVYYPALADKSPTADPDFDGISNAIEYVLGGNPSQPSTNIIPTVTANADNLVFTFNRTDASKTANITLIVEASTDITTWPESYVVNPGTPSAGVSIQENEAAPDTITVTIPQDNATAKFARLRVLIAP